MSRDNDFPPSVRATLAARAGHRCSFPDCGVTTSGPSHTDPEKSVTNGWACHIFPAGDTGPRSELTPVRSDLRGLQNAIWMCETHGSLIDKNAGIDFPPERLIKWRTRAEAGAARLQKSGLAVSPTIDVIEFPRQTLGEWLEIEAFELHLSKLTLLSSNDPWPCRIVAQALAFAPTRPTKLIETLMGNSIEFSVVYGNHHHSTTRVSVDGDQLRYWDGPNPTDSIAGFYQTILVDRESIERSTRFGSFSGDDDEDASHDPVAESLNSDPLIAAKVARSILDHQTVMLREIRSRDGEWKFNCDTHRRDQFFSIDQLSHSERISVHLDLILTAVRLRGEAPMLLIIDNVIGNYDSKHIAQFGEVCRNLPANVQVLVTDPSSQAATILRWPSQKLAYTSRAREQTHYLLHEVR